MTAAGQTVNPTADPRMGTWKLNLAKSTHPPGLAPQRQTLKRRVDAPSPYRKTVDDFAIGTIRPRLVIP
jgi:hypothetical protein